MIDFISYYQLLEIPEDMSIEGIKSSFRKLSLVHHPDKNNNSPGSNAHYRLLLNAYVILSDPVKREEYDSYLRVSTVFKNLSRTYQKTQKSL